MKKKLSAYLAIAMIIMNISISAVCADGTVITEIGYNGLRNTALVDSSAHTIDCYISQEIKTGKLNTDTVKLYIGTDRQSIKSVSFDLARSAIIIVPDSIVAGSLYTLELSPDLFESGGLTLTKSFTTASAGLELSSAEVSFEADGATVDFTVNNGTASEKKASVMFCVYNGRTITRVETRNIIVPAGASVSDSAVLTGVVSGNTVKVYCYDSASPATTLTSTTEFSYDAVYLNQTFENYATGSAPGMGEITPDVNAVSARSIVYGSVNAEVVEEDASDKALLFHGDEYTSQIYNPIINYPQNLVVSMDIKLKDGSVKELALGFNSTYNGYMTPLVRIEGNKLVCYDDKELFTLADSSKYYNIAMVTKSFETYDVYVDGAMVLSNFPMPENRFSAASSRFIFKRTADDREFMLDNLRIYQGKLPDDSQFSNQSWNFHSYDYINVENDRGDYLYFDSKNCDNQNGDYSLSKYSNFRASVGMNSIVCNRLYHTNPDRPNDYIIMTKNTTDQSYFDITLSRSEYIKDNSNSKSTRTYNYYLIETDFFINRCGVKMYLPVVYDNQSAKNAAQANALTVNPDGSVLFHDGSSRTDLIKFGEWINSKVYVDVLNHNMDIYINNRLIKNDIPISKDIQALTLVRWMFINGAGDTEVKFDNMKVTGLVEPYENGVLTKTHVFTDESAERDYLSDKIAFSELNNLVFANGEKTKMNKEQIFENGELYISLNDAEGAFDCDIQMTGNTVIADGESSIISKSAKIVDSTTYIPVMSFASEALGKRVFYHEKTGLIIISDSEISLDIDSWKYMYERDFNKITILNDIDYLNNFMVNERPTAEKLYQDAMNHLGNDLTQHPRVMLNGSDINRMKAFIGTDGDFTVLYNKLIAFAERALGVAPVSYHYNDPLRMNVDDHTRRIIALALAWNLSEDVRYLNRCYEELRIIADFPDYNTATIHDVAEWNETLAVGFDWIYNGLNDEQREYLASRILNKSLKDLAEGLYGRIKGRPNSSDWGNLKWFTNMNTVSVAGIVSAASAVAEYDPEYCMDVISKALYALEYPLAQNAPSGAWIEGPNYWNYHNESAAYVLLTLRETFGSYYGLDKMKGYKDTGKFMLSMIGPRGVNTLGDTYFSEYYQSWGLSLCGNVFNDQLLLDFRLDALKNNYSNNISAFDLISYSGNICHESNIGYGTYTEGMESYTVRGDANIGSNKMYFSTHFGNTQHYHSQNDCGTFVLDIDGVRWAEDLGMDDYNLQNQLGYGQKDLYRYRAEGHNTLVINPDESIGQREPAFAPVIRYDANSSSGYVISDMSEIYEDVNSLKTGYYIGDDMKTVTARFEIDLKEYSDMWWFMHTKADIEISGNTAYLTKEGKTLAITFETDADTAELKEMAAQPLPTSPQVPEQNQNAGVSKVAINFTGTGNVTLTIKMTPVSSGLPVDDIMNNSIDQWDLQ